MTVDGVSDEALESSRVRLESHLLAASTFYFGTLEMMLYKYKSDLGEHL